MVLSCPWFVYIVYSTQEAKNLVPDKPDQAMDWMEEFSCQCPIMPHHPHLCIYPLNGLVTLQRRARRARRLDFTLIVCNNSAQRSETKPDFPEQICAEGKHVIRCDITLHIVDIFQWLSQCLPLKWFWIDMLQNPSSCLPVGFCPCSAFRLFVTRLRCSMSRPLLLQRCGIPELQRLVQLGADILIDQMHPSLNWDGFVFFYIAKSCQIKLSTVTTLWYTSDQLHWAVAGGHM